jgi:hypothetical protein
MPDLESVLAKARALLKPFEEHFTLRGEGGMNCGLYSVREIQAHGKIYCEMFFAGVRMNKGAVGFYFMPIYTHEQEFNDLSPSLRKLLKGKSCFHLKKLDDETESELTALLKKGHEVYKKAGWV